MSGIRLGRSEHAVRAYLTNGMHDEADLKSLAQLSETGRGGRMMFHAFTVLVVFESSSSDVVGMFLPATEHHGHLKCRTRDLASKTGHYFCFLALMVGRGRQAAPS